MVPVRLSLRKGVSALFFSAVVLLGSCAEPKGGFVNGPPARGGPESYSGYIIVSNNATRNVVLLDPDFRYVRTLLQLNMAGGEVPWGLAVYDSENVLVTIEGVDRVMKLNLRVDQQENYIVNTNLAGTMRGLARLSGGDVVVSDNITGAHLERFMDASPPTRVTTGGWPLTLLNTMTMAYPLSGNNFLACAGGTSDVVRTYNNAGAQTGTASATAPVPSLGAAHDTMACVADASGRIAVAYSGASDAIRVYNSALTTTVWTFQDASLLATPVALGVRPNGNFLAVDATNVVVEISAAGSAVRTYSSGELSTVNQILVMP